MTASATNISPLAGRTAPASMLIDVDKLLQAYHVDTPDPSIVAQRVAFGTSGHRGSAFERSFNAWHVLAITQAICDHRKAQGIAGPLFLGMDTHALSVPACATALEVLAANGVDVMLAKLDAFTPTPAVSHAILAHNRGRHARPDSGVADGIVMTPSHNPPQDGGLKYNPPHGGPAGQGVTGWIQAESNRLLDARLDGVRRVPHAQALQANTTHRHDFLNAYVDDLGSVIDMHAIRAAKLRMGVDPLGGAGVHYWPAIAQRYGVDLTVTRDTVDPRFSFVPLDWDGKIRMDPSSPYAMQALVAMKSRFDIAFACDTDHDRHAIVTPTTGLLTPDHYLAVAMDYLFRHRAAWPQTAAVGKTVVSSRLIDSLAARLGRPLLEVPVGFKWFAEGLLSGALGFAGEESAGATFLRRDGHAWTTDKDGIAAALLSAEITARTGRDPGQHYASLAQGLGSPVAHRWQAPATVQQKQRLAALLPQQITAATLAGEPIDSIINQAPGNGEPIGGIKVSTAHGWFVARPSGTEDLYKLYAESFAGPKHLQRLLREAQGMVDAAMAPTPNA
jgi:phosphoglucomutase